MMTINKKLNRYLQHFLLFGTLALMSNMSFAGIYKWVDDEGNVHYGQQRPKDASSQKMNVPQHAPRDTSSYKRPGQKDANAKTDNAQANGSAKKEPEKKKETKAEKKRRLAACAQTRKKLARMESVGRIRVVDKDGNTTYMSQKQKEERMAKDRKSLEKHCK